jgi:hypothetical protein
MGGLRGRGTIFKGDFFIWTKTKTAFAKKKMLRHSGFALLHRRLKPEQSYKYKKFEKLTYQILLENRIDSQFECNGN